MARQINQTNTFTDKLVKLIPTEIVGAYMVLSSILGFNPTSSDASTSEMTRILIVVVFFILLALTPAYLWKISGVRYRRQLVMTTVSFAVWVYTLGGPFVIWKIFYQEVAAIILVIWSLILPLVVPAEKENAPPLAAEAGQ
jgi:hypothetical protein